MSGTILIGGGTGFLGTNLKNHLNKRYPQGKFKIKSISRSSGPDRLTWQQIAEEGLPADTYAVYQLVGKNIFERRWTPEFKQELLDSRIKPTKALANAIVQHQQKWNDKSNLKVWVCASGSAFPASETIDYTEDNAQFGDDFGGYLCKKWEESAALPENINVRSVICRIGMVLAEEGGALPYMLPLFKLGLGGKIATGNQYFAWIHKEDLMRIFEFVLENDRVRGPVHCNSPTLSTNYDVTKALGKVLNRPTFFTVPEFAAKLAFGERHYIVTQGKRLIPKRLIEDYKFEFKWTDLEVALKDVLHQ